MTAHFNGAGYENEADHKRLSLQHVRIKELMKDGVWRTLDEIARATGDPAASVSAQLRHLRKPRFGAHIVNKRRRNGPEGGLWEYQVYF
jgi:hypothetical protein